MTDREAEHLPTHVEKCALRYQAMTDRQDRQESLMVAQGKTLAQIRWLTVGVILLFGGEQLWPMFMRVAGAG